MASAIVTTMPPLLETGPLGTGLTRLEADAYTPPVCGTGRFSDVPAGSPFCRWIEQLDRDGIMSSCDGGTSFCPDNPVTRKQLAMFLGMSMRGTATWHPAQGSNWLAPPVGNVVTTVDDAGDVGQYTSITIGVDGLPIISYYDNTVEALKVAHCGDVACAGQATITTVDNAGNLGGAGSITIGSDGLPIISYYDATVDLDNGIYRQALKVAHCNDVACAGQDETLSFVDDPAAGVGLYTSIAIGADGLPIISYHDFSAGTLKVAHCNDVACSGADETITTVDAAAGHVVGQYTSLTIGADALPIISYYDATDKYLMVAHCNDVDCAPGGELITAVDSSNGPDGGGQHSSITIGPDGLPIISYYRGGAGNLAKVVHCNDVACTDGDESIWNVGNYGGGHYTSITIGTDGLPIMSYYNNLSGALEVVHCNTLACFGYGGHLTITVDDPPATDVGQYTSITIGADGLPIITYYDATAGALKVAHCSNDFCTPYFRRR